MTERPVPLDRRLVLWQDETGAHPDTGVVYAGPVLIARTLLAGVPVDVVARGREYLPPVSLIHRGRHWIGGLERASFWLDGLPSKTSDVPAGDGFIGPDPAPPLVLAWRPGEAETIVNSPLAIAASRRAGKAVQAFYGALPRLGRPDEVERRVAEYADAVDRCLARGWPTTQKRVGSAMTYRPDPAQMTKTVKEAGFMGGWSDFVRWRRSLTSD